ncbi:hypothetical protein ACQRBN_06680 [Bariatricus sp. SGI.154]|uniref:hypothetical protein n=1 Tax=Bariatricus sp. SGI.154 TaxID=3420549 RepID=UPI003D066B9D
MTVEDFLKVIKNSDRLRIIEDGKEVFTGYVATLSADHTLTYEAYKGKDVKEFRAVPEIRHKRWQELGLMQPLEPDKLPEYSFNDLQMTPYYTILI